MTLPDRLRAALARPAAAPPLQDDAPLPPVLHPAAVLIAVTDRPDPGVILTLRQPHLRRHAGQIAFPGGRIDPADRDADAAALREAQEEIGLDPAAVVPVGRLTPYPTGSGYRIIPVVGVIPPDLPLTPQEAEVAALFEVPLAFVLDPSNHRQGVTELSGHRRVFYEMAWGERRIWGITAGLIVNLSRQLGTLA